MKVQFVPLFVLTAVFAFAQRGPQGIPSLKRVPVPGPSNLSTYVKDQAALLVLGKALFWDMQVGSDGKVACASCHFHSGSDHRLQNQISDISAFQANTSLATADFPFHQLSNPNAKNSTVLRDSSKRVGSAGVYLRKFDSIVPGLSGDQGTDQADPSFRTGNLNVRQVTGRNAPSVINAVFNFRNFWDGRASDTFTGPTPFGLSDTRATILSNATGNPKLEILRLANSSLASQAVGPVLNGAEMSYDGRSWADVGKKILPLRPLAYQKIAADDSVLAAYANSPNRGFRSGTYLDLVKSAFQGVYLNSNQLVDANGAVLPPNSAGKSYSQAEFNFSLFFGLAVQAYEATLVANDSRVDQFADGQTTALSATEIAGMQLFVGRTGCNACHEGAETTLASVSGFNGNDPLKSGRETGFFNVGLRPPAEDLGLGATDGLGQPLSATFPSTPGQNSAQARFKTPGLRNVEFTGPYFHNGGQATLEQVVQFYNRGGDFPVNAVSGPNIRDLDLSATDQAQIVAFLKALSDDRVRYERAPFDHPEICVANGGIARADGNPSFPLTSADRWAAIPEIGQRGNTVPLQTFDELLAGIGADGSRAHNLSEPCGIEAVTATGIRNENAASYAPVIVAQNSIASAKSTAFPATTTVNSSATIPTTLGGITLSVTDSQGITRPAPLFYSSPAQINYAIPDGTAVGPATVKVSPGSFQSQILITPVAPGIFADSGFAAANVLSVVNGVQTVGTVYSVDGSGNRNPIPINLNTGDTYLILYGTGIRNHKDAVTVRIGANTYPVDYAGPQGAYPGEDQVNIRLPQSLRGSGLVELHLVVDGNDTNTVRIYLL